jgi:hypothetical protein
VYGTERKEKDRQDNIQIGSNGVKF